jgi:tyrosinase
MSRFRTAALDPIFWLHHANIDRLWEAWRRSTPARFNTSEAGWLTMHFEFVDPSGNPAGFDASEVLEIEAQLGYTYSGLPAPVPAPPPGEREELFVMPDDLPAEMIGGSEEPVVLEGAADAETTLSVSAPSGPGLESIDAGGPSAVYLNIDDIEGEANPGLLYGVYLNLPDDEAPDPDSPHYVGVLPFFGIESTLPDAADDRPPHRLGYVYDITDTVAELTSRGRWNPNELRVRFSPIGAGPDSRLEAAPPPVRIGRVSLFIE